jgi:hypothetical protein
MVKSVPRTTNAGICNVTIRGAKQNLEQMKVLGNVPPGKARSSDYAILWSAIIPHGV